MRIWCKNSALRWVSLALFHMNFHISTSWPLTSWYPSLSTGSIHFSLFQRKHYAVLEITQIACTSGRPTRSPSSKLFSNWCQPSAVVTRPADCSGGCSLESAEGTSSSVYNVQPTCWVVRVLTDCMRQRAQQSDGERTGRPESKKGGKDGGEKGGKKT